MRKESLSIFIFFFIVVGLIAFSHESVKAQTKKGAIEAIQQSDLKRDLFALADDHFRGRATGTLDELKAAMWLAEEARKAGLEPAGDDGTFFQFFPLMRQRVSSRSTVQIGDRVFTLWKDVIVYEPTFAKVDAPMVFVNDPETVSEENVKGKVVVLQFSAQGLTDPRKTIAWRYPHLAIRNRAAKLAAKGVKAIVWVSDDLAEQAWPRFTQYQNRGAFRVEGGPVRQMPGIPILWVRKEALDFVRLPNQKLKAEIYSESFTYPSVNVVAKVKGTDPKLNQEYVLFSGHHDHDGVRNVEGVKDSIYNGADDNATACAALLAIGRAFHKQPAKRSALFVWHGAEEIYLAGSFWFADHPTVPRESLIAVLNADMIGMNAPDSAALLGSTPPHLNSSDLVKTALAENAKGPRFKLDTAWDNPSHFEGFYFRSDHYPYAKKNIPAIFFTTLTHPLYHTPADEASTINIEKLTKVARWMYLTGFAVANATDRPRLEPGFKLER